jgi:hypothetical protein
MLTALIWTSAYGETKRVALESYVGTRPNDAEHVMETLRKVLAAAGFTADPKALASMYASHQWRPGGSPTAGPKMSAAIFQGENYFHNLDWQHARDALGPAIALSRDNRVAWVREPRYRDQLRQGMLYLALSYAKLTAAEQDAASTSNGSARTEHERLAQAYATQRDDAMADLLRMFPSFVVARTQYGLEAEQLYQRIQTQLQQPGRGTIDLDIDDPDAAVYLDAEIKPPQSSTADLLVGSHDILVITNHDAHVYSANVISRQTTTVRVRSEFDSALVVSNDWVGFKYVSQKQHDQQEPKLVADLVGPDSNATLASVFTLTHTTGKLTVVGTLYGPHEARVVRTCQQNMATYTDTAALTKLVRCLTAYPKPTANSSVATPSPMTPRGT